MLGIKDVVNDREVTDGEHLAADWNPGGSNSVGALIKIVMFVGMRDDPKDELEMVETVETYLAF